MNFEEVAPIIGIEALKTNVLIWGLFLSTTMEASIHLGPNHAYWNTNFEELQNLFDITQKLILVRRDSECDSSLMGESHTFSRSSGYVDESKSTCLLRFRLMLGESVRSFRIEDGKIKLKNFDCPMLTEIYLVFMENRLSLSGVFSQDLRHWRSSRRSRKSCKVETLNPKSLKIEPSLCQCSMTPNGQREEIQKNVFQIPNKSRISRRDSCEDTPGENE